MRIETIICDGCGTKYDGQGLGIAVYSYAINVGTEMDPSGNGYNINWKYVDFCMDCMKKYKKKHPKETLIPK